MFNVSEESSSFAVCSVCLSRCPLRYRCSSFQAVIGEDSSGEAGDRMSRRRRAQPSVGERITKKAKVNVGTRDEENYVSYKSGNCLREQG